MPQSWLEKSQNRKFYLRYSYYEWHFYIFTYRDDAGKVGIGRLPDDIQSTLSEIGTIYHDMVPDKKTTTFHTWFKDMPPVLKQKVEKLQKHRFWNRMCDSDTKCVKVYIHLFKP